MNDLLSAAWGLVPAPWKLAVVGLIGALLLAIAGYGIWSYRHAHAEVARLSEALNRANEALGEAQHIADGNAAQMRAAQTAAADQTQSAERMRLARDRAETERLRINEEIAHAPSLPAGCPGVPDALDVAGRWLRDRDASRRRGAEGGVSDLSSGPAGVPGISSRAGGARELPQH